MQRAIQMEASKVDSTSTSHHGEGSVVHSLRHSTVTVFLQDQLPQGCAVPRSDLGAEGMENCWVLEDEDIAAVEDGLRFGVDLATDGKKAGDDEWLCDRECRTIWFFMHRVSPMRARRNGPEVVVPPKLYDMAVLSGFGNQDERLMVLESLLIDLILQLPWEVHELEGLLFGSWFDDGYRCTVVGFELLVEQ